MKRATWITAALLVLLAWSFWGCSSTKAGDHADSSEPGRVLRTKTDLYQTFGVPDELLYHQGDTYLYYRIKRTQGGSFGIGYMLVTFLYLERRHKGQNTLIFQVDDGGNVISSNYLQGTDMLRSTLWPFGE
jgi:hypothetical protein